MLPRLSSSSQARNRVAEQGRRAACHMLGTDPGSGSRFLPTGIYAVPELASVGMTEEKALLGEVPSCTAGISGDRIAPPPPAGVAWFAKATDALASPPPPVPPTVLLR